MNYQVSIERRALKSLAKIPENDRTKITKALISLEKNPRPAGSKKLTGRNG